MQRAYRVKLAARARRRKVLQCLDLSELNFTIRICPDVKSGKIDQIFGPELVMLDVASEVFLILCQLS